MISSESVYVWCAEPKALRSTFLNVPSAHPQATPSTKTIMPPMAWWMMIGSVYWLYAPIVSSLPPQANIPEQARAAPRLRDEKRLRPKAMFCGTK